MDIRKELCCECPDFMMSVARTEPEPCEYIEKCYWAFIRGQESQRKAAEQNHEEVTP